MKAVILALAGTAAAATTAYPQFVNNWSSYVEQELAMNQGGYALKNGDQCCPVDSPNCQVQVQYNAGMNYFDLDNQRTATVFGAGSQPYAIVTLYGNIQKEFGVDASGNCQSYCPLGQDGGELTAAFNVTGSNDGGKTTINGQAAEVWITPNTIFNITMDTDYFYIDQTNFNNAVPIFDKDLLTPFGQPAGQSQSSYLRFNPTKPDPKYFTVNGMSTCQQDSQCGQSARQAHRLINKNKKMFFKHYYLNQLEEAEQKIQAAKERKATLEKYLGEQL